MEMLVALAILAVAVTIIVISLSKLNASQALEKSTSLVMSVVDQAHSLTFSAKDDSQYGVYFEDSGVTLFKGATYSPSDPLNVVTAIDYRVSIRSILLAGGGSSVVFKRLTGETDQPGTLELFLKDSPAVAPAVTITKTGRVSMSP